MNDAIGYASAPGASVMETRKSVSGPNCAPSAAAVTVRSVGEMNQARRDHGEAGLDKEQDAERRQNQLRLEQVDGQRRGKRGEKTEQDQHGEWLPTMERAV